jgi:hypothetical protein
MISQFEVLFTVTSWRLSLSRNFPKTEVVAETISFGSATLL